MNPKKLYKDYYIKYVTKDLKENSADTNANFEK